MWLVMATQKWDQVPATTGIRQIPACYGQRFIPVFETYEEARRQYPHDDLIEIREKLESPRQTIRDGRSSCSQ